MPLIPKGADRTHARSKTEDEDTETRRLLQATVLKELNTANVGVLFDNEDDRARVFVVIFPPVPGSTKKQFDNNENNLEGLKRQLSEKGLNIDSGVTSFDLGSNPLTTAQLIQINNTPKEIIGALGQDHALRAGRSR